MGVCTTLEGRLQRERRLERRLGSAIQSVLDRGARPEDLYRLYALGEKIESVIARKDPEGFDDDHAYHLLKSAIGTIYQLHDEETRMHCHKNPESLHYWAQRLMRKEEQPQPEAGYQPKITAGAPHGS